MRALLFFAGVGALAAAGFLAWSNGIGPGSLGVAAVGVLALFGWRLTPRNRAIARRTARVSTQPRAVQRELSELAGNLEALASTRAAGGRRVRLVSVGPNQIAVIKAIREHTRAGLKESKELTDAARAGERPVVAEGLPVEQANAMAAGIRNAGGRVEFD